MSRRVEVSYTLLDEPGIVTIDVQTNAAAGGWVSIGEENFTSVYGDVNRVVATLGTPSKVYWHPDRDWPGFKITDNGVRIVVRAWATNAPPDYAVFDLVHQGRVQYYASAKAIPNGVGAQEYKTEKLVMRRIPAAGATFRMGSPTSETSNENWRSREILHYVSLTNDYYMGVYPVTQRQYVLLTGLANPSFDYSLPDASTLPVDTVSYNTLRGTTVSWPGTGHAVSDNSALAKIRRATGVPTFDLPTDAEWEFACRAGTGTALNSGKSATAENFREVGWFLDNAQNRSHAVGELTANAWGLYDMHGSLMEWTLDWYSDGDNYRFTFGSDYTPSTSVIAPTGPVAAMGGDNRRVRRGGQFMDNPETCRSAFRGGTAPEAGDRTNGFRLTCTF